MANNKDPGLRIDMHLEPDVAATLDVFGGMRDMSRPQLINEILGEWAEKQIAIAARISRVVDLAGRK